jgi:hypothetical protein
MYHLFDAIASLGSPWNMIVLVVMIGSVAGLVGTIAKQMRKYASHRLDMNLKRELVERGLSVEEIERIIVAKSPSDKQSEDS